MLKQVLEQGREAADAALAVTPAKRAAALPDVPTLAESVIPGFNSMSTISVTRPPGLRRSSLAL